MYLAVISYFIESLHPFWLLSLGFAGAWLVATLTIRLLHRLLLKTYLTWKFSYIPALIVAVVVVLTFLASFIWWPLWFVDSVLLNTIEHYFAPELSVVYVCLLLLALSFSFLYGVWLLILGFLPSQVLGDVWFSRGLLAFVYSVISGLVVVTTVFGLVVGLLILSSICNERIGKVFHDFNAHLKSVCRDRESKDECPKSEIELQAFNPQKYASLQQCASTRYSIDEKGNYSWRVISITGGTHEALPDENVGFKYY